MKKLHPKKKAILDIYGREPVDLDDLGKCVVAVLNAQPQDRYKTKGRKVKVAGIVWEVEHQDSVSNTHNCPLDGKLNWGGYETKNGVPRGYPGWYGRVWCRYAGMIESFGGTPWDETVTHTGTGGWGSYDGPWTMIHHEYWKKYGGSKRHVKGMYPEPQVYSWDFRFFDADWECSSKHIMWETVKHGASDKIKHRFEYFNPEIVAADEEFLKSVKNASR